MSIPSLSEEFVPDNLHPTPIPTLCAATRHNPWEPCACIYSRYQDLFQWTQSCGSTDLIHPYHSMGCDSTQWSYGQPTINISHALTLIDLFAMQTMNCQTASSSCHYVIDSVDPWGLQNKFFKSHLNWNDLWK